MKRFLAALIILVTCIVTTTFFGCVNVKKSTFDDNSSTLITRPLSVASYSDESSLLITKQSTYYNGGKNNICAYYKDCQISNASFVPYRTTDDEGNSVSISELYFEDCLIEEVNFTIGIYEDTNIHFIGENTVSDCLFLSTQTAIVNGNTNFTNCKSLVISFGATGAYNLGFISSDVSFTGITSTNYSDYDVTAKLTGGSLVLPECTLDWTIDAVNVNILASDYIYSGVKATACTIIAEDCLHTLSTQSSTVYFSGDSTTPYASGGQFIGNYILFGTPEALVTTKSSFTFRSYISTNNLVGGSYNGGPVSMIAHSDAKVVFGNYNGYTVLGS